MIIGQTITCSDVGRGFALRVGVRYVVRGFLGNGWENPDLVCLEGVNGWFSQDSFTS